MVLYNLMIKDLRVQKTDFLLGIVFSVIFLVMSNFNQFLAVAMIGYVLISRAYYLEDKGKNEQLINCLPLQRRDVIRARYMMIFVYAAYSCAVVYAAIGVIQLLDNDFSVLTALDYYWGLISIILIAALTIPLTVLFEGAFLQYLSFAVLGIYAFIALWFYFLIKSPNWILAGYPFLIQATVIFAAVLLIFYLSYRISLSIYEKKDL